MKTIKVQMAVLNWCSICARSISKGESAWRFNVSYVCADCYRGGES